MIKKLRFKFVTAAMIAILAVLFIILGTVNVLNYKKTIGNADDILSILAENDGAFPAGGEGMVPGNMGMEERGLKNRGPESRDKKPGEELSPEIPFETRFFSVLLSEEGEILSVDTGKIAAVDEDTAKEYAEKVLESKKEEGFISDYRYKKKTTDEEMRIIFLDCGRSLSTFRSFLHISILVAILGVLAVLVLVIIMSERIVRPFTENYEKQKRFITDAGHEIKTPLTVIDADAAVLEMEWGENEWIQDIRKQTLRLKELTNDLIYLSRMEENQENVSMIDFPVSDIVAEQTQSFQALARARNKSFQCQIEPMLTCCGDEKNIRRLVSILLDNALKYSEMGGEISLTLKQKGKNVCLTVFNTAEFVPKENLSELFERFYRADQSRNSQTGGYGIGLSIAKAIVTAHKGKITASSDDGKSLLITVLL